MKAWTDYPFVEMGDIPGQPAPLRNIDVIDYDGDKYCIVIFGNIKKEIKAGYIYQSPGRLGEVPQLTLFQLFQISENASIHEPDIHIGMRRDSEV